MKRTTITMDGNGILSIPSNLEDLWMSEGELVDMLHVTAPKLNSVIRAIYKEGMLSMSEVQYKDETSVSVWQTLYNFPMIVAICFRLHSLAQHNFVMLFSRDCTKQKRKQLLSCNSTERRMPFVENGRIFDASVVHCRIDLLTH